MVTDVQQQECLGKLLADRDLLGPTLFQAQGCSQGPTIPATRGDANCLLHLLTTGP